MTGLVMSSSQTMKGRSLRRRGRMPRRISEHVGNLMHVPFDSGLDSVHSG